MVRLTAAAGAWKTPRFASTLTGELEALGARDLPLQGGLARGSHVADEGLRAIVLAAEEQRGRILARVSVFFTGVIAGCSCADDPTPLEGHTEYCELLLDIDPDTGETDVRLVTE